MDAAFEDAYGQIWFFQGVWPIRSQPGIVTRGLRDTVSRETVP